MNLTGEWASLVMEVIVNCHENPIKKNTFQHLTNGMHTLIVRVLYRQ